MRSFGGERLVAIGLRRPLPRVRLRLVDLARRCCRTNKSRPSSVRGDPPRSRRIGAPSRPRLIRGGLRAMWRITCASGQNASLGSLSVPAGIGPYPVPAHAALWSLFRLGGRRSPVGDPRQHKKADPKNSHNPGRRAPPVRWRLGDSSGKVPERVSGAEHAYHYEGQAADQHHPPAHASSFRSTSTI